MIGIHFKDIFLTSLNTYKAFDRLTLDVLCQEVKKAPKTIWQILNHLIIWQDFQYKRLRENPDATIIDELATWAKEKKPRSQQELVATVAKFKQQLELIKNEIFALQSDDSRINRKLTIIQEITSHLTFHLGEVILLRRMQGDYPLPEEMKGFLLEKD